MKLRKILCGLLVTVLICSVLTGLKTNEAKGASNVLTLSLDTTYKTHRHNMVYIETSIPEKDIKSIESIPGKVKKTANKYWKNATNCYFYQYDDENVTHSSFLVYSSGYYTVRLIDKKGNKYVKSINVKNILPSDEIASKASLIKSVSTKKDSKGYYTLTADVFEQFSASYDKVLGKRVGDKIKLNGYQCEITNVIYFDDNGEILEAQGVKDYTCRPVVKLLDTEDYYTEYPEANVYEFGLVCRGEGEDFYGYDDYSWEDCYVDAQFYLYRDKTFKFNKKTKYYPAYYNWEQLRNDFRYTNGTNFLKIKTQKNAGDKLGMWSYTGTQSYLFVHYDTKTGEFTDYLDEICDIYSP